LEAIFGADGLLTDPADCWAYGYDNSRRHALPQAVAFAADPEQVREITMLCNRHGINLLGRGRGTGTTGATVPDRGGVVLSFERMTRILEINPDDRLAVVQPGTTNDALQQAVGAHGFFWPPDPTSSAVCTLGGNLAYNSAGPRAVKYGTPRENTLGLKAVTGGGVEIRTGVRTTKGVVGYDLTRLLVGSEGTLALITEATLRLTPLPETTRTLQGVYAGMEAAATAVAAIMAQPVVPCALEFMDGAAIDLVRDYAGLELPETAGALLMIEVDGPADCIDRAVTSVQAAAKVAGLIELHVATGETEVDRLWKARRALSPALRKAAPRKINEDVAVPVSRMPAFMAGLEALGRRHRIDIVNFGHAGNGNIHVNLLVDPQDRPQMTRAEACLGEVFQLVLDMQGTLSGEHGVGLEKRDFVAREIQPDTLALMHAIKRQFDPNGILNPGKGLPEPSGP
jgi:D-lactate dehydrogenase